MRLTFTLNGVEVAVDAAPGKRLLSLLREDFDLTSLKGSCLQGRCGLCSVLVDGELVPSCMVPVFSVFRKNVVTMEGFKNTEEYRDVESGFLQAGVSPCGSCGSAKVLTAHVLLLEDPNPHESTIRKAFSGIRCRCTVASILVEGVKAASNIRRIRSHGRKI